MRLKFDIFRLNNMIRPKICISGKTLHNKILHWCQNCQGCNFYSILIRISCIQNQTLSSIMSYVNTFVNLPTKERRNNETKTKNKKKAQVYTLEIAKKHQSSSHYQWIGLKIGFFIFAKKNTIIIIFKDKESSVVFTPVEICGHFVRWISIEYSF